MEIKIRRVTENDVDALADIAKNTFYDTFTGTCTDEDMQSFLHDYFNEKQVAKELSNPEDFYFFAEIDNTPRGYIRFMEDYNNFPMMRKWKSLELKRLYVKKEFHGKGVAQQLMDFIKDYAFRQQYQVIWLGVWEHNIRAKKFYEKNGFKDSGYTHDFPIGNTPQRDNWLWKFL